MKLSWVTISTKDQIKRSIDRYSVELVDWSRAMTLYGYHSPQAQRLLSRTHKRVRIVKARIDKADFL